jgi:hypothetical protein
MANFDQFIADLSPTPGERDLITGASATPESREFSVARALETIYIVKGLNAMVERLIKSNERLAASNDRHSRSLNWLAVALVFLGLVQVAAALAAAFME